MIVLLDERRDDGSSLHMTADIDADGSLRIEGHDLGPVTRIISDDGEYEYCYRINASDLPAAVAALGGEPGTDVLDLLRQRWSGPAAYELGAALRDPSTIEKPGADETPWGPAEAAFPPVSTG
jgi:hypothetical protein